MPVSLPIRLAWVVSVGGLIVAVLTENIPAVVACLVFVLGCVTAAAYDDIRR